MSKLTKRNPGASDELWELNIVLLDLKTAQEEYNKLVEIVHNFQQEKEKQANIVHNLRSLRDDYLQAYTNTLTSEDI